MFCKKIKSALQFFCIFAEKCVIMLSEEDIIEGFRQGDSEIIRKYFYEYCRIGYNIFDQRYQLSSKENLDFMSLAHQYALYLMEHDWKPLEDHSPQVSFKTWLINGFRFVVLDALKWYRKEYGSITFEDYLQSYDMTSDLRQQFNQMVLDVCDRVPMGRQDRLIIDMLLRQGYKTKEVAVQMGVTPSAVSQKWGQLKEKIIIPYFKMYFDMNLDMPEVIDTRPMAYASADMGMYAETPMESSMHYFNITGKKDSSQGLQKPATPRYITSLRPNEIYVFGSDLKGLHGGGTAYTAYRKFGAVLGQGVGLQGQSYAIPTMQGGVETIRPYVNDFLAFAKEHPEWTFLVTRIGCGLAGFVDEEISPLFNEAHDMKNIVLPEGW